MDKKRRIFRYCKLFAVVAAMVIMTAAFASAEAILSPFSTWEYTFTDPGGTGWTTASGGWATGPAPFGNVFMTAMDPFGYFDRRTIWLADGLDGYDLWVRTTIDLAGFDLNTIRWDLGVDNGYALYINGNNISSDNAEGYTWRWEYSGSISPAILNSGINYVAVALEDHGGATAFDMQITGERLTAVPEPAVLLLFGSGVAGLLAGRRIFIR